MSKGFSSLIILIFVAAILAIGGYFLIKPQLTKETKPQKNYHVGIISGVDAFYSVADSFKAKMSELGYVEGKNITYKTARLNADPEGEKQTAEEFVKGKVDLIFAFPTEPALIAKAAAKGTNIPVVFGLAGTEETNLVENLSRPGGNVTGVRFNGPDLAVKRLEILTEMAPKAKRIYIVYDKNYPLAAKTLEALESAAPSLDVTLVKAPVSTVDGIKSELDSRDSLGNIGIDAILIMPELLSQSPQGWGPIRDFAKKHKVPIAGSLSFEAYDGAVFSYAPKNDEIGSQAAIIADKILKGTPAGEIFVVTPTANLIINYKLAQSMGLTVSEALLTRAKEIIR